MHERVARNTHTHVYQRNWQVSLSIMLLLSTVQTVDLVIQPREACSQKILPVK